MVKYRKKYIGVLKFVTHKIFGGEIVLSKLLSASRRKREYINMIWDVKYIHNRKNYLSDVEISLCGIPLQKKKFIGSKVEVFIILEI